LEAGLAALLLWYFIT